MQHQQLLTEAVDDRKIHSFSDQLRSIKRHTVIYQSTHLPA